MRSPLEGNPEFVPGWDVLRDLDGRPVTITWDQVRAVWHAIRVVEEVRRSEGHQSLWHPQWPSAELGKSRLLGRMLVQGRPPTRTRPPVVLSGPEWEQLPGGDPFAGD